MATESKIEEPEQYDLTFGRKLLSRIISRVDRFALKGRSKKPLGAMLKVMEILLRKLNLKSKVEIRSLAIYVVGIISTVGWICLAILGENDLALWPWKGQRIFLTKAGQSTN